MKKTRHEKILEIIQDYDVETQEDLAVRLREAGFNVTQATVSRDIREMQLSKVSAGNGNQKYAELEKFVCENYLVDKTQVQIEEVR